MAVEVAADDDNLAKLLGLSNMTGGCGCVAAVTRVACPYNCTLDLINNKGILVFYYFLINGVLYFYVMIWRKDE